MKLAALFSVLAVFAQSAQRPGDGGPASKAEINDPVAIAVDGSNTLYIAEQGNFDVIRRVDLNTGIITTLKMRKRLETITSLTVDSAGNILATDYTGNRVCRINPTSGSVSTIVGGKRKGFSSDGGPSIKAGLDGPLFSYSRLIQERLLRRPGKQSNPAGGRQERTHRNGRRKR